MNLESALGRRLYRYRCPDSLTLGEYHQRLLPAEARREIRRHVETCPRCGLEIRRLEQYLQAAPLPEPLLRGAHTRGRVNVSLGFRLSAEVFSSALAVRGQPDGLRCYRVGASGLVTLDVQRLAGDARSLVGLMLNLAPEEFQACLWRGDEMLQTVSVDSLGNFLFEAVPAGRYHLILKSREAEICLQGVEV